MFLWLWIGCQSGAPAVVDTGTLEPAECESGGGEIWVLRGADLLTGRPLTRQDALTQIEPEASHYSFGEALYAPGDLDGDGVGDVVVRSSAGVVVLSGSALAAGTADVSNPHSSIVSDAFLDVTMVGDLDGDGIDELVLSQWDDPNAKVFGSATLAAGGVVDLEGTWAELLGAERLFAAPGDFDGDGAIDLVMKNDAAERLDIWLAADIGRTELPSAQVNGGADLPRTSEDLGRIRDIDGDGHDDLLLDEHVFSGALLAEGASLDVSQALASQPLDASARSPRAWFDLDGDGALELLKQGPADGLSGLDVTVVAGASWLDEPGGTSIATSSIEGPYDITAAGALPDLDGDGVDEAWLTLARSDPAQLEVRIWSGAEVGGSWDLGTTGTSIVLPDCCRVSHVIALDDLDGDGLPEVAISSPDTP